MADEQENVRIRFDSNANEVARGTNALGESLDNVQGSATDTNRSMRALDATFEQVYGDLQPLTTRMGEAESVLLIVL